MAGYDASDVPSATNGRILRLMEDILGLGKTVAEGLQLLKEPVQSMFGPAWNELAGSLGDAVRHWRDMRRLARALGAVEKIQAMGLSPKAVEPAILFPLLDAASLTNDPSLKDKWDSLLANASLASESAVVLPAYIEILRQLIPPEAKILDWLYESRLALPSYSEASRDDIIKTFHLSGEDYILFASDLHRLQVIDGRRSVYPPPETKTTVSDIMAIGQVTSASHYRTIELTPLGIAFIKACRCPV